MALQKLNITNTPNQRISVAVEVDGNILNLEIFLRYNRMAGYWVASITNIATNELVLDSLPLVSGVNLLEQCGYLKIGSCAVIDISGADPDVVDLDTFTVDFLWYWDDNI
jgi:hypothetical protein